VDEALTAVLPSSGSSARCGSRAARGGCDESDDRFGPAARRDTRAYPACTNFAPASRDGPHVSGLWRIFSAKLVHEEGGVRAFYGSDKGFGCAIGAKADRGVLLHIAALL
jgi:anti-sigma factor RsiW